MKAIIITLVALAVVALNFAGGVSYQQHRKIDPVLLSAVLVTQNTQVDSVILTFSDGESIVVDARHHEGFDDVSKLIEIVKSAKHHYQVSIQCGTGISWDSKQ